MDNTDRGAEPIDAQALVARLKAERAEKLAKATNAASELKEVLTTKVKPRSVDPWEPALAAVANMPSVAGKIQRTGNQISVTTRFLLCTVLGLDWAEVGIGDTMRLGRIMRRLGWRGPQSLKMGVRRRDGLKARLRSLKGYSKPLRRAQGALGVLATNEERQNLTEANDR